MEIHVFPLRKSKAYPQFSATLASNATLLQLKRSIHTTWKIHPRQQVLFYLCTRLEGDNTILCSLLVKNDAKVFVGFTTATIPLTLCALKQKKKRINADLNWTVGNLKREVAVLFAQPELNHERVKIALNEVELDEASQLRALSDLPDEPEMFIKLRVLGGNSHNLKLHFPCFVDKQ